MKIVTLTHTFSLLLVLLFVLSSFTGNTQSNPLEKNDGQWNTLSLVTFDRKYDPDWGIDIEVPNVNPIAQKLDGQEVELNGFIIPLTGKVEQSHFMLSRYPQNMCFFCGKAGPESAAQVFTKDNKKIAFTDKKIKVKGILRINAKDKNNLLYTIEDATVLSI